jgi:release factor glutamine methyltransferase
MPLSSASIFTVAQLLEQAGQRLCAIHCDHPRQEARLLLAHVTGWTQEDILRGDGCLSKAQQTSYEQAIARREAREPLSHILGKKPFWALDFSVNCHTLTPRSDSETLIDAVLCRLSDSSSATKILDLGTGTGCLLLTLLDQLPEAVGVGVDFSPEAIKVAQHNAVQCGLEDRASFLQSNWTEKITESFDIVISNPPYIETNAIAGLMPEVRDYEPHLALDGGEDGLDAYRTILADLPEVLADGAAIYFEHGAGQADPLSALAKKYGFSEIARYRDVPGIERVLELALS